MKQTRAEQLYRLSAIILAVFMLAGCGTLMPVAQDEPVTGSTSRAGTLTEGGGWWYARFHINWPEGAPVRWYLGTLIGGEVVVPVQDRYARDISLWRVHRRAARDGGHVFSFIFYSTPQTAQQVYASIENNVVVKGLLDNGQLDRVQVDDVSRIDLPNIEDTSDERWDDLTQKTWPAMIMGASRMWLDMASALSAQSQAISDLDERYRKVQAELTDIWQAQGQHAILHHLNGIYAYQPMLMRY